MDSKNDEPVNTTDDGQDAAVAEEKLKGLFQALLEPDDDRRLHNTLVVRHMADEKVLEWVVDRLVEPFQSHDPEAHRLAGTTMIWLGRRAVPRLAAVLFRSRDPGLRVRLAALLEAMGPHLDAQPPVEDFLLLDLLAVGDQSKRVREAVARATRTVWRPGPYRGF